MTAAADPRRVSAPSSLAAWNRALNREHAMAHLRARGGRIVRAIEHRRRRLVAARVLAGPHARALDAGCEDGWMTAAWAGACASVVLLDVDPAPLAAAARALADSTSAAVRTVVADVADAAEVEAALAGASFDVVVLSALLEHLPDPDRALAALVPALAPGGRLVVFVPADGPILAAKRILRTTRLGALVKGLPLEPAPGHLQRFDRGSLAALLGRHGRVAQITFDPAVLGYLGVVRRPRAGG
jgi:SAM-dependent methyltransferase